MFSCWRSMWQIQKPDPVQQQEKGLWKLLTITLIGYGATKNLLRVGLKIINIEVMTIRVNAACFRH